ncbi:MAG: hypothetical protein ACE1ZZ_03810, partial [Dehalococcoidia bacterium]
TARRSHHGRCGRLWGTASPKALFNHVTHYHTGRCRTGSYPVLDGAPTSRDAATSFHSGYG